MKKSLVLGLVLVSFVIASLGFVSANPSCKLPVTSCSNNYCANFPACTSCSATDCCLDSTYNCICYISCSNTVPGWSAGYYGNVAVVTYYTYYNDSDHDGYGDSADYKSLTGASGVYSTTIGGDCNDNNANIHPGATEICNSFDDDCDGLIDVGVGLNCVGISSTYWTNLNGAEIISSADKGDMVFMKVPGVNLALQNITYNISQFSSTTWWNPFSWFKQQTSTVEASLATANWVADTAGLFMFKASVDNVAQNISNNLTVTDNGASGNSEPIATIVSPTEISGLVSSFTHTSSDEDDLLRLTWDFGDGNTTSFENYSKALTPLLGNIAHTYVIGGKWYEVSLTATEMTRGQSDTDSKSIYVFKEGINVVPIVTSPVKGQAVGNVIFFNASSSYVADCSASSYTCSDTLKQFLGGELKCCYVHAPKTKTTLGYNITLSWVVTTNGIVSLQRTADWGADYGAVVDFIAPFQQGGSHVINMDMTYTE